MPCMYVYVFLLLLLHNSLTHVTFAYDRKNNETQYADN